mmetsp:Transcript_31471/g.48280  ORF Transcript_31471/g.48280 Transcript_31471/m.48280 type:complete len:261 (+) Transcript_31471:389-1171(+)
MDMFSSHHKTDLFLLHNSSNESVLNFLFFLGFPIPVAVARVSSVHNVGGNTSRIPVPVGIMGSSGLGNILGNGGSVLQSLFHMRNRHKLTSSFITKDSGNHRLVLIFHLGIFPVPVVVLGVGSILKVLGGHNSGSLVPVIITVFSRLNDFSNLFLGFGSILNKVLFNTRGRELLADLFFLQDLLDELILFGNLFFRFPIPVRGFGVGVNNVIPLLLFGLSFFHFGLNHNLGFNDCLFDMFELLRGMSQRKKLRLNNIGYI